MVNTGSNRKAVHRAMIVTGICYDCNRDMCQDHTLNTHHHSSFNDPSQYEAAQPILLLLVLIPYQCPTHPFPKPP